MALESSTSSAKALLYDTEKKISSVKTRQYPVMFENESVHDARIVFREMLGVAREVIEGNADIDMISLGGTWHSLCLFGKDMNPQIPALPWCYTGASDICRALRMQRDYVDFYYHRTGCMVNAIYPFYKLMLLKQLGFNLEDYKIGGQGVYNTFMMTGRYAATECTVSGTGLMNIHSRGYDPLLLRELGISVTALPEIVPYDATYPIKKEIADYLGVRRGTPVIPSNSDGGLNQIGVGALKKGVMTFSVGTSGAIRLTTDQPIIPDQPSIWCYRSPKSWLSGAATSGACNCVDWFKTEFAFNDTYQELESEFRADGDTPVFLPFIFGERCPGWRDDRRGGFENLQNYHTKKDMYTAVQEGVLFNLFQCYETLTKTNGEPEHIKLSGGILNSCAWTQMCADIFQKKLEIDRQPQSSLMGGVVLGMELLGVIRRAEDFLTEPAGEIKPNPERAEIYLERYRRYKEYYNTYEEKEGAKGGGKWPCIKYS